MKVSEAITIDKDILDGTPVFKGTRVPVKNLFDYLEAGDSLNDFLDDFDYILKEYCLTVLRASEKLFIETVIQQKSSAKKKTSGFRGSLKLTDEQ